jgi:hypothetical protein
MSSISEGFVLRKVTSFAATMGLILATIANLPHSASAANRGGLWAVVHDICVPAYHAGGILGGISTGQPVVARFAVKPTSSILQPRRTIDRSGADTEIATKGRHDPCVGIRAVPVGRCRHPADSGAGLVQRFRNLNHILGSMRL